MGDNSALTEEHRRALGFHHLGHYKKSLEIKKKADADFKNSCKRAIADGVSVGDIKLLITLESPSGEAEVLADLKRTLEVARWAGAEVGTQFDFLDMPDRSPLSERAFVAGRVAGMKGETCVAPHDGEAGQEWIRGWHEGQETLMAALDLTKAGAAEVAAEEGEAAPKKRGRPRGRGKSNGTETVDAAGDAGGRPTEGTEAAPAFGG